jgi:hypothetical protein
VRTDLVNPADEVGPANSGLRGQGQAASDDASALQAAGSGIRAAVGTDDGGKYVMRVLNGQDFAVLLADGASPLWTMHDDSEDTFLAGHPPWISQPIGV